MFIFTLLILSFNIINAQKTPNFTGNRNTIIHLFEWKWVDIANECETFLQNKGYGGVQVSPPNENLIISNRPWWERYQPVSYNLTTRSGNESEFADMLTRCNKVGIRIYADVIINHMAASPGTGTAGNKALSDVKTYPAVPYNPQDFHPTCDINNYLNPETIRDCELNHLRDLDQSSEYVRDQVVNYLNHLIDLGVAGFRIDSAKYIWPEDLTEISPKLENLNVNFGFAANSKAFIYQDVPIFDKDVVSPEEYTALGVVVQYNYSTSISRVFSGKDKLANLRNWGSSWGFLRQNADSFVFVDSHNTQRNDRILNYKTARQYKMTIAFMLAHTYGGVTRIISSYFFDTQDIGPPQDSNGIVKSPIIYDDGSCGNGYVCEHRWPQIFNMIDFKNVVADSEMENWWSNDDQQIAFSRGNKGFIAFSNGGDLRENIQSSLPSGAYCDIISGSVVNAACSGKTITVDQNGVVAVSILQTDYDGVVAIHTNSKIA